MLPQQFEHVPHFDGQVDRTSGDEQFKMLQTGGSQS